MRRSVHVQLVLLPMLATATVATAQPGPQDPSPPPPDPAQQQPAPIDPSQQMPDMGDLGDGGNAPGMTDPTLSPPGMTPTTEEGQQMGEASLCNQPETWPLYNQELGVPPYECTQVVSVCDDPVTWNSYQCGGVHWGGGAGFHVIRGGFGHYFGTGGG
jgi:hypothetical protein